MVTERRRLAGAILVVILLAIFAHLYIAAQSAQRLPEAIEIRLANAGSHPELKEKSAGFIPVSQKTAGITAENGKAFTATVIATSPAYAELFGLSMVSGAFFVEQTYSDTHRWIVIGEDSANELFMRVDVAGKQLMINGESYTIVGVYQADRYLLRQLSSTPAPTVYIPFQANTAQTLSVFLPADIRAFEEDAVVKTRELTYESTTVLDSVHHAERRDFLRASKWILFSCLCMLALLWAFVHLLRSELVMLRKRWWLYALCLATLLLLFAALQKAVWIPAAYLPEDNVFELGAYMRCFMSLVQSANAQNSELDHLFANTVGGLLAIDGTIILAFIILGLSGVRKDITADKGECLK